MSASTAVLKAEFRLFRREPGALFWIAAFPTVLLVVLGLVPDFRQADPELDGRRMVEMYVPVSVLLAMIMAGLQSLPPVLTGYREQGVLRRMSTTPVRPVSLLGAQIVLHSAAALASALLVIAVGRLVYDVPLPRQPAGYALALAPAVLCAMAMGAAVSAVSPNTRVSTMVGTIVFFPMMFVAGVYYPVQLMPDLLRRVVESFPFGAAARALDQAAAGDWPGWAHLGVTAAWTAVLVAVAARWFRWN
jgi:ABC-2 type transport system permease protein